MLKFWIVSEISVKNIAVKKRLLVRLFLKVCKHMKLLCSVND